MTHCTSCGSEDILVLGANSVGWIIECESCRYRWQISDKELTA